MKKYLLRLSALALVLLGAVQSVEAQTTNNVANNPLTKAITDVITFINIALVPLVFAIAFIVFLWGVAQAFVIGGADEEKRENGKKFIMWGLIAFFVMVSVWGMVNLLVNTFGFGGQQTPCIPTFGQAQPCASTNSGNNDYLYNPNDGA
ncbi:MAG: pilin [Patescibacteria group bacterium]